MKFREFVLRFGSEEVIMDPKVARRVRSLGFAWLSVLFVLGSAGVSVGQGVWTEETPMPTPRYVFATTSAGGKVYTFGGRGPGNLDTTVTEIYDPTTNTWSEGTPMPSVEDDANAVTIGGLIYVVGGANVAGFPSGDLLAYDPSTGVWQAK